MSIPRSKILPHHMMQLHFIVDAMTACRGWSLDYLGGHVLRSPAAGFRARRDIDKFLDRNYKEQGSGFLGAAMMFGRCMKDPQPETLNVIVLVREVAQAFKDWLGESKYMHGLETIPPSRFSSTNANGLWEYSPFLCGVGLVDALDISYRAGLYIWDCRHEPLATVHLHNMLVQKGYIKEPIGLFAMLSSLFATSFFPNGKRPKSGFRWAMDSRIRIVQVKGLDVRSLTQRRREIAESSSNLDDIRRLLSVDRNLLFQKKSNLSLYYDAGGNVESIPESDITLFSQLATARLRQVRQYTDESGQRQLEETELVRRHLECDHPINPTGLKLPMHLLIKYIDGEHDTGSATSPQVDPTASRNGTRGGRNSPSTGWQALDPSWRGSALLRTMKHDICDDVCGRHPFSALNYVWAYVRFVIIFARIQMELQRAGNPLYRRAFEANSERTTCATAVDKLVYLLIQTEDDECLRIMAEVFEGPRAEFWDHTYWLYNDWRDKVSRDEFTCNAV